ncbi:hypothetical protein LCGC14_1871790, partial [marine sediment metagenome]
LRPPGETPNADQPSYYALTSDQAESMTATEMATLIADAEGI